jgi:hypothetical protein
VTSGISVILDEYLIEETKVAAIRDKRKVSGIVQELLEGWLAERKARENDRTRLVLKPF